MEVNGRMGGQRKNGRSTKNVRSKEEREIKGRKGDQRKKGRSKEEREAKENMEKAGRRRKYEGWHEKGRYTLHLCIQNGVLV